MEKVKKLVFFCSSSNKIDPKYNQAACEIVQAACLRGYTIVSGGSILGTMGGVADAAVACGGKHIGILPRFMEHLKYPSLTELVWTDTMSERKDKMLEGTCGIVALPGGIGTMDELFEAHVLKKLGKYDGRLFVLNIDGFYDPLKALLERFVETNMTSKEDVELVEFCDSVEELVTKI